MPGLANFDALASLTHLRAFHRADIAPLHPLVAYSEVTFRARSCTTAKNAADAIGRYGSKAWSEGGNVSSRSASP